MGLYDVDHIVHQSFDGYLNHAVKKFDYFENHEMWNDIANGGIVGPRAPSYTMIHDPKIRVIFYMVCLYVIGKAHKDELFLLGWVLIRSI